MLPRMQEVNILLADDHQIVLDGLREIFEAAPGFRVVGQANNARAMVSIIGERRPDLLLMDLNMPGKGGLEILEEIKTRFPALKILVLTMYNSPEIVRRALALGADGYLLKDQGREELLHAIREVLSGKQFVSAQLLNTQPAIDPAVFPDDYHTRFTLTERELEILRLIARSYTNKEIGDKLYISEFTVATHRRNLKRKLRAENTVDLVRFAYDHNLL
ncbi:MAG: response regulator transcription factor [Saprospirales bacterium]|nr:response regulator transcription factor [Saprospirales bacterium]